MNVSPLHTHPTRTHHMHAPLPTHTHTYPHTTPHNRTHTPLQSLPPLLANAFRHPVLLCTTHHILTPYQDIGYLWLGCVYSAALPFKWPTSLMAPITSPVYTLHSHSSSFGGQVDILSWDALNWAGIGFHYLLLLPLWLSYHFLAVPAGCTATS